MIIFLIYMIYDNINGYMTHKISSKIYKNNNKWCIEFILNGIKYKMGPYNKKRDAENKLKVETNKFRICANNRYKPYPTTSKKTNDIEIVNNKDNKSIDNKQIKRKKIAMVNKWIILQKQNYECNCCMNMIKDCVPEFDHIIPLFCNGPDEVYNLQGLCKICHDIKSQKIDIQIKQYLPEENFKYNPNNIIPFHNIIFDLHKKELHKSKVYDNIMNDKEKSKYIINNFFFGNLSNFDELNLNDIINLKDGNFIFSKKKDITNDDITNDKI